MEILLVVFTAIMALPGFSELTSSLVALFLPAAPTEGGDDGGGSKAGPGKMNRRRRF